MLIGQYQSRIDEKGRAVVPAKFRHQLTKISVVARWYENCLVLVSESGWLALLDKLTGKSQILTGPVRNTDRFILGSAFEIEIDAQGRFVIPKILRDYAKIGEEVTFLGLGNRVEIWDSKSWGTKEKEVSENADKLIESLARDVEYGNK